MNTDGLKTADNWQATGVEEWPKLDFFSLWWICTSYCIVLTLCILGILCGDFAQGIFYTVYFISYFVFCELYCICALYIGHFPWWLCKMYFVYCVFIYFVVNFFSYFAHHTSYIGICILYFSHCYTAYLCSVHCIILLFLRWVCASRLICCQDPP